MKETNLMKEQKLIKAVNNYLKGAEVVARDTEAHGIVKKVYREDFETLFMDVAFGNKVRTLGVLVTMKNQKTDNPFIRFVDTSLVDAYDELLSTYLNLDAFDDEQLDVVLTKAKVTQLDKQFDNMKQQAIDDFEESMTKTTTLGVTDDFYYALGWLASHIKRNSIVIPDYLEKSFVRYFGDAEYKVVDTNKRTSGGFRYQWAMTCKMSLKQPEELPVLLQRYLSKNGKVISNGEFIRTLVSEYGFAFGTKQDKNEIMKYVPNYAIESFELGYAS